MAINGYEESLLEFLISALYARVGEPGTLKGEGKSAKFEIKRSLGGGSCAAGASLEMPTPSGRALSGTADILLTSARGSRLVLDLMWAVDELGPIKARTFDMMLLKRNPGAPLWSMMVYLRPAGGGLSAAQVRDLSFPYDEFFAIEHQDPQNPAAWVPILDRIEQMMGQE
jgi:hypothetical protein